MAFPNDRVHNDRGPMPKLRFTRLAMACSAIVACSGGSAAPTADGGAKTDAGAVSDSGAIAEAGGGSPDAESGSPDSGGAPGDAAVGDDGGAVSCTSPDAAGLPYKGIVELSRVMMPPAAPRFDGIGQFETTASAPPSGGCSGTMMGACCFESTAASSPVAATVGTITVSDGTSTLGTLTPPGYAATSAMTASFTWTPATPLKIAASGGTIDAFTASIVAPGLLTGLTPSFSANIDVPLKSDLVVSWMASTRACSEIAFDLSQGAGMPHIGCVMADSAGTLTVPAALLGMLTATTGRAVMERVEGKHVLAANADIGIVALDVIQTTTTYSP
jgi:hypothetical protein